MNRLLKWLLIAGALAGALSGCATYDYGYGYSQPYYGYDVSPHTYDYGYGYPYYYGYSPGYYVGPPVVGFDFRHRDNDRHDHRHWDRDHGSHWSADERSSSSWSGDRRLSANRDGRTRGTGTPADTAEGRTSGRLATEPAPVAPRNLAPTYPSRGVQIAAAPRDSQRGQVGQAGTTPPRGSRRAA